MYETDLWLTFVFSIKRTDRQTQTIFFILNFRKDVSFIFIIALTYNNQFVHYNYTLEIIYNVKVKFTIDFGFINEAATNYRKCLLQYYRTGDKENQLTCIEFRQKPGPRTVLIRPELDPESVGRRQVSGEPRAAVPPDQSTVHVTLPELHVVVVTRRVVHQVECSVRDSACHVFCFVLWNKGK